MIKGFTPEILGLHGENITVKYLKRYKYKRGVCNGTEITSSNINKPFNAGIHGFIIGTDEAEGTISLMPFGKESIIQYLNCSVFLKTQGIVAPWTAIGITGQATSEKVKIPQPQVHLQIYEEGKPKRKKWDHNYIDPEEYIIDDLIVGNWHNHYEGSTPQGYPSIDDTTYQINNSKLGSEFPYERKLIISSPYGTISVYVVYKGTIVGYTDNGINCYCSFIKCVSSIPCVPGPDPNYYMTIDLLNENTLSGANSKSTKVLFSREKLPILIGPDKIEKIGEMSVSPENANITLSKNFQKKFL